MTDPNEIIALRDILLAAQNHRQADEFAIVPDGYKLEDLERFQDRPRRIRGEFKTDRLEAFSSYLKEESGPCTPVVFVDGATMRAVARIDHGCQSAPGWGCHTASLSLAKTPEFIALGELLKGPHTQDSLIGWILDWAPSLTFALRGADDDSPDEPNQANQDAKAAIVALRKLDVEGTVQSTTEAGDLSRARSVLEKARIANRPPTNMAMFCSPYIGLQERCFTVRFAYKPFPNKPPEIAAHAIGLGRTLHEISGEFAGLVKDSVGESCDIYQGTFTA